MRSKAFIVTGIVIVIVAAAAILVNRDSDNDRATTNVQDLAMQKGSEAIQQNQNSSSPNETMAIDDISMAQQAAYADYSPGVIEAHQQAGNKVVLFFHAQWCPDCRAADAAFKASLEKIPDGVTVLKTDYDSNKDLKRKYGVTYQHTFVQIDNDQNMVTKWVSGDVAMLKKNIK